MHPQALLPGGPVTWERIDQSSARAIVTDNGLSASMVAHFASNCRMTPMMAEEDGDLTTPYHGSGSDYQPVGKLMIPYAFTISRAAKGKLYPFIEGQIIAIRFDAASTSN